MILLSFVSINHRESTLLFVNCKWKLETKSYLFYCILESASVRSEMEIVLGCENDVQVDALTFVDFTMLYAVCLTFFCWCHEVVIIYLLVFHCWLLIY